MFTDYLCLLLRMLHTLLEIEQNEQLPYTTAELIEFVHLRLLDARRLAIRGGGKSVLVGALTSTTSPSSSSSSSSSASSSSSFSSLQRASFLDAAGKITPAGESVPLSECISTRAIEMVVANRNQFEYCAALTNDWACFTGTGPYMISEAERAMEMGEVENVEVVLTHFRDCMDEGLKDTMDMMKKYYYYPAIGV